MNEPEKKLIVMDVMPLLYRGHFAFMNRPRMTSSGINTSAIYIFATLVQDMFADAGATHMALVMDTSPTFRHEKYPEYKAKRDKLPEDIAASIPMAEAFAQAMNIPFLRAQGFEADDLMGTLAVMGEEAGLVTWLVTPDKDIAQLVTERTFLCRPAPKGTTGNEVYDVARVCAEWGVQTPAQMIDFLGIAGDASDNIPGIPGVGPKTATQLLSQYGDLETIIAHAAELKGKLAERVAENVDKARISRWLAEIRKDVPLEVTLEDLAVNTPNEDAVREFCAKYELRSVLTKIFPDAGQEAEALSLQAPAVPSADTSAAGDDAAATDAEEVIPFGSVKTVPHKYILCDTVEKVDRLISRLERSSSFAFDTETTSLDVRAAKMVGLSFAMMSHEAYYVPVSIELNEAIAVAGSDELPLFANVATAAPTVTKPYVSSGMSLFDFGNVTLESPKEKPKAMTAQKAVEEEGEDEDIKKAQHLHSLAFILEKFSGVFGNPKIAKYGHNLKYDLHILRQAGIEVAGPLSDSMLAHYVFDPASRHGMDPLAREYLHYDTIHISELIGPRGKQQLTMDQVEVERVAEYAAEDADITWQLHEVLVAKVKETNSEPAFEQCENPLIRVLLDMESEGVRIDTAVLADYSKELGAEIAGIEQRVYDLTGETFNIASNQQLGVVLFEKLKLPDGGKTATGQFSTGEEVLQGLVDAHPVIKEILEYRTCTKLKSTYVDKLPLCIDSKTGRIHTSFNQALTETGRLSSDNPNLQNIPIRTDRGKRIRAAFIARDKNHVLMSADYSQIELRLVAAMSGDEAMIEAFANDADIHLNTAARVYHVPLAEVTKEMRSYCKMVNFGIIYGISAFGLAQRLGTSRTEAADLIKAYFELYPGVKRYMDKTVAEARDKGYVETLMGRKRPLRDINSRNATIRSSAERNAINTPVQGSAADLIKLAMVAVHKEMATQKLKSKLILQVHDELVFDVCKDEVEKLRELVARCMTTVMTLAVPLKVDIGVGDNWLEAH